jgi:hypothetical protein
MKKSPVQDRTTAIPDVELGVAPDNKKKHERTIGIVLAGVEAALSPR